MQQQGLLTDSLTPEKLQKNRPAKMTGLTWERLAPVRQELRSIADARGVTMAQVRPRATASLRCVHLPFVLVELAINF